MVQLELTTDSSKKLASKISNFRFLPCKQGVGQDPARVGSNFLRQESHISKENAQFFLPFFV